MVYHIDEDLSQSLPKEIRMHPGKWRKYATREDIA